MAENSHPPTVPTEPQAPTQQPLKPHRGTLTLVLGILSIVCCFICGIIAWVMANKDFKEMAAGRMDPSGMGLTKAGKICGIVGIALQTMWFVLQLLGVGFVTIWGTSGSLPR